MRDITTKQIMKVSEYTNILAQIAVLKEIAAEYPGKTIENIIVQMEARQKEIGETSNRDELLI